MTMTPPIRAEYERDLPPFHEAPVERDVPLATRIWARDGLRRPKRSGGSSRPDRADRARSRAMRSAMAARGSPQKSWTSACAAATRSAASEAPPK